MAATAQGAIRPVACYKQLGGVPLDKKCLQAMHDHRPEHAITVPPVDVLVMHSCTARCGGSSIGPPICAPARECTTCESWEFPKDLPNRCNFSTHSGMCM